MMPVIVPPKRKHIEDEEEIIEETESEESEDEETEEDRAFINDGRPDKLDHDTAAIDPKNIIEGRPKRQRKAPQRWEHPDAAVVMQKFCDKWQVTEKDIEEIFNEHEPEEPDTEDASFHSGDEEEEAQLTLTEDSETEDSETEETEDESDDDEEDDDDE